MVQAPHQQHVLCMQTAWCFYMDHGPKDTLDCTKRGKYTVSKRLWLLEKHLSSGFPCHEEMWLHLSTDEETRMMFGQQKRGSTSCCCLQGGQNNGEWLFLLQRTEVPQNSLTLELRTQVTVHVGPRCSLSRTCPSSLAILVEQDILLSSLNS